MKCLDCKDVEMNPQAIEVNKARDVFEVVWKCPSCEETFFATIYRDTFPKTQEEKGEE